MVGQESEHLYMVVVVQIRKVYALVIQDHIDNPILLLLPKETFKEALAELLDTRGDAAFGQYLYELDLVFDGGEEVLGEDLLKGKFY